MQSKYDQVEQGIYECNHTSPHTVHLDFYIEPKEPNAFSSLPSALDHTERPISLGKQACSQSQTWIPHRLLPLLQQNSSPFVSFCSFFRPAFHCPFCTPAIASEPVRPGSRLKKQRTELTVWHDPNQAPPSSLHGSVEQDCSPPAVSPSSCSLYPAPSHLLCHCSPGLSCHPTFNSIVLSAARKGHFRLCVLAPRKVSILFHILFHITFSLWSL